MTYSPLTDQVMYTDKSSSRGGVQIERVNVHHWGGTGGGVERLVESDDLASANYLVLDSGLLIASVPEDRRAWTSGSWEADAPAITFEVQNATGSPDYRVSAAAIKTLTAAIGDIATRYDWPSVTRSRVRGHREFAATACPGPYLYPRLGRIARDADRLRTQREDPDVVTDGDIAKIANASARAVAGYDIKLGPPERKRTGMDHLDASTLWRYSGAMLYEFRERLDELEKLIRDVAEKVDK